MGTVYDDRMVFNGVSLLAQGQHLTLNPQRLACGTNLLNHGLNTADGVGVVGFINVQHLDGVSGVQLAVPSICSYNAHVASAVRCQVYS